MLTQSSIAKPEKIQHCRRSADVSWPFRERHPFIGTSNLKTVLYNVYGSVERGYSRQATFKRNINKVWSSRLSPASSRITRYMVFFFVAIFVLPGPRLDPAFVDTYYTVGKCWPSPSFICPAPPDHQASWQQATNNGFRQVRVNRTRPRRGMGRIKIHTREPRTTRRATAASLLTHENCFDCCLTA